MANIGMIDRGLRFFVGAVLAVGPFVPPVAGLFAGLGGWTFAVAAVGAVLFATAVFRFCPAYALLGIRTCDLGKR